jgi:hypothetical protein
MGVGKSLQKSRKTFFVKIQGTYKKNATGSKVESCGDIGEQRNV